MTPTRTAVESTKRRCKRCNKYQILSEFYPRFPSCKHCTYEMNKAWQLAHKDRLRIYRKNWKNNHRDRVNELKRLHGLIHREDRKLKQRWIRRVKKLECSAREAVKRALQKGTLVRPKQCEKCKQIRFVVAHHPNYQLKLSVQWLCNPCHRAIHPGTPRPTEP